MAALEPRTPLKNGAYRIEAVIGRGGFGITYRAFDVAHGRLVALKECFPTGSERHGLRVRSSNFASHSYLESFKLAFRHQAVRLRRLEHPAVVELYECFEDNETVYLAMKLLEGPTLLQKIDSDGPLAPETARECLQVLSEALATIHDTGFFHLDIKPENIILTEAGPVLVDFDLLLPRDNADYHTRPLALATQVGTPGYAPLEQYAQNAPLSAATDIYALGATFYHALTGQAPASAVDRAVEDDFLARHENIEPSLEKALEGALQLKAQHRPQNIAEFSALLKTASESDDGSYLGGHRPVNLNNSGFYRVSLDTKTPIFPTLCACCAAKAPKNEWMLNSASGKWQLPLCDLCEHHQQMARQASAVTVWGIVASLVCAVLCVVLSIVTKSVFPILLGFVAMLINFSALNYGGLKNSRAEEMLSDFCCDLNEPATYVFNGRIHIWRFRNARFAQAFREANAAFVV